MAIPKYLGNDRDDTTSRVRSIHLAPGLGADATGALSHLALDPDARIVTTVLARVDEVATEYGYPAVSDLALGNGEHSHLSDGSLRLLHFATAAAMSALLREAGLRPTALVAHGIGEISALVASGVYSVEVGSLAICFMNDAHATHPCEGGSVAVATDEIGARQLMDGAGSPDLVIAGTEGPRRTVISGDKQGIASLLDYADKQNVPAHRLSIPFLTQHPRLGPIADYLRAALRSLPTGALSIPVYSVAARRWYTDYEDFAHVVATSLVEPGHLDEALLNLAGLRPDCIVVLGAGESAMDLASTVLPGVFTVTPFSRDPLLAKRLADGSPLLA